MEMSVESGSTEDSSRMCGVSSDCWSFKLLFLSYGDSVDALMHFTDKHGGCVKDECMKSF